MKTTTVAEVEVRPDGSQTLRSITCDAPVGRAPAVTPLAARQQIQKLVPRPKIGVAPPGGVSLVNIQTLLWVGTPADQDLGTVTLLGQRVGLRVHVQRVGWAFGDGNTAVMGGPGRAYHPANPCRAATCPSYWGHIYSITGRMTVTAQVTWTGEFRVGAGPWQPIAGTVTGPRQTTTLTVREARGVLVPDETNR